MKKSMYSLMLGEDVVAAVDRLAETRQTTRSGLVNEILAEYLSLVTPEMRVRGVFDSLRRLLDEPDRFRFLAAESRNRTLTVLSSLRYRYRPTVHYEVELFRSPEETGVLRAYFRTQSPELLAAISEFFALWAETETEARAGAEPLPAYALEEGKFIRTFDLSGLSDPSEIGREINAYIRLIDQSLKDCLSGEIDGEALRYRYARYLESEENII